ncbi:single-stranded DNA-binding protein [Helicobacter mehlei]|uniref:Single-stranded DNA-binding protein n=1 Tax=Helicobacter mehlei TaxID=2316080 RepID=A0A553UZI9_9HELI|nr:single-stranded DNA-binding protein [Helicobacter mehlei]TSA85600.1 single-stranded DNA-binding protein [Helicobacter mehlei]
MFNKITLVGHLTRDVELRHTPGGMSVGKIGIATNHVYKRQDGSKAEETCFIDVDLFGRTAEVAGQYLNKGSKVLIEGRLRLDSWNDQQGNKRSKHVVVAENLVMLDSKKESGGQMGAHNQSYPSTSQKTYSKGSVPEKVPEIDVNDDLPF